MNKFKSLFSKKNTRKEAIKLLEAERLELVNELTITSSDDDHYQELVNSIAAIDDLIPKKDKKKDTEWLKSPVLAAVVTTAGLLTVALANMKYEEGGNIVTDTVAKGAMNKIGR